MKQQFSKNMVLLGGASLVSIFLNFGLIDGYYLIMNPFVFGGGKPLMNSSAPKLFERL
jgi:dihydrofolate reductase